MKKSVILVCLLFLISISFVNADCILEGVSINDGYIDCASDGTIYYCTEGQLIDSGKEICLDHMDGTGTRKACVDGVLQNVGVCDPYNFPETITWECTDFDKENNPLIKGYAEIKKNGVVKSTVDDLCVGDFLNQYYCENPNSSQFSTKSITCEFGCQEGVCLEKSITQPPISYEKSDFVNNGFIIMGASPAPKEGEYDREIFLKIINKGKEVINGYLNYEIKVKDLNGNIIDSCITSAYSNWLTNKEVTIKGNCVLNLPAGIYTFTSYLDSNNNYDELSKSNNEYNQKIEILAQNFECKDSDTNNIFTSNNMEDEGIYIKGVTKGYDLGSFSLKELTDYCIDNSQLKEYLCSRVDGKVNTNIDMFTRDCSNGCQEGICLKETVATTQPEKSTAPSILTTEEQATSPIEKSNPEAEKQQPTTTKKIGIIQKILNWLSNLFN